MPLDEDARKRVLQYALARFKPVATVADSESTDTEISVERSVGIATNGSTAKQIAKYSSLAELARHGKGRKGA
jgi:hypothetical protein